MSEKLDIYSNGVSILSACLCRGAKAEDMASKSLVLAEKYGAALLSWAAGVSSEGLLEIRAFGVSLSCTYSSKRTALQPQAWYPQSFSGLEKLIISGWVSAPVSNVVTGVYGFVHYWNHSFGSCLVYISTSLLRSG